VSDDHTLPEEAARSMTKWVSFLTTHWKDEVPSRIHIRQIDSGGAPEWAPEFARYVDRGYEEGGKYDSGARRRAPRNPELRLRTTRAFRKLRKNNIREFEVLYRTVVLGYSITDTADWLTQRAIRNNKPERYSPGGVKVLLYSAAHKVMTWL
jgi:hypothetical protein